ncbi:MAG: hypothetical protein RBT69_03350 [Spirochaetia bacterium]|jgi:hypothetical protein|nr:hypothetical protein [Spirochaetia bacterium]
MEESVFIIDQGTGCGRKISESFLSGGYRVIATEIENSESRAAHTEEDRFIKLNWNCFSPFSSKNVILGLRLYNKIKYSIIIFSSPEADLPLFRQNNAEIQKSIDFYIKSQVLITRELLTELARQKPSLLFLVLESRGNGSTAYRQFFRAFINNLLKEKETNGITINAFETGTESTETFAKYVFSTIQGRGSRAKGKWFKKFSFLNYMLNPFGLDMFQVKESNQE